MGVRAHVTTSAEPVDRGCRGILVILYYIYILNYDFDMKAISLKLDDKQLKLLDDLSRATNIPKSALVRKGIRLVLMQAKEDVITNELKREIDSLLREDSKLLKRLSRS
jgi:Ribbon-helix-helix domain